MVAVDSNVNKEKKRKKNNLTCLHDMTRAAMELGEMGEISILAEPFKYIAISIIRNVFF